MWWELWKPMETLETYRKKKLCTWRRVKRLLKKIQGMYKGRGQKNGWQHSQHSRLWVFHGFNGLEGMYISARKADIIERLPRPWSSSLSASPCRWNWRRDLQRLSFTLSIFLRKSASGPQQLSWLNWGGSTYTPLRYAVKPRSTLKMILHYCLQNRREKKDIRRGGSIHKGLLVDSLHQAEDGRRSCVHICSIASQ